MSASGSSSDAVDGRLQRLWENLQKQGIDPYTYHTIVASYYQDCARSLISPTEQGLKDRLQDKPQGHRIEYARIEAAFRASGIAIVLPNAILDWSCALGQVIPRPSTYHQSSSQPKVRNDASGGTSMANAPRHPPSPQDMPEVEETRHKPPQGASHWPGFSGSTTSRQLGHRSSPPNVSPPNVSPPNVSPPNVSDNYVSPSPRRADQQGGDTTAGLQARAEAVSDCEGSRPRGSSRGRPSREWLAYPSEIAIGKRQYSPD